MTTGLNCSPGLLQTGKSKEDLSWTFGKLSSKSKGLNRLPMEVVEHPSLEGFKNRLGKCIRSNLGRVDENELEIFCSPSVKVFSLYPAFKKKIPLLYPCVLTFKNKQQICLYNYFSTYSSAITWKNKTQRFANCEKQEK